MSKILLMNGPLKCGKDDAILHLAKKGLVLVDRSAKVHLHLLTQSLFCIPAREYFAIYDSRDSKEVPLSVFGIIPEAALTLCSHIPSLAVREVIKGKVYLSIREAMIYVSEVMCKGMAGQDYFGVVRAASIPQGEWSYDGSTGFTPELPPLIKKLGQDNILLLRIHRPDFEFSDNDSRGYIPDGVVNNTVDIQNNGTLEEYYEKVSSVALPFFLGDR